MSGWKIVTRELHAAGRPLLRVEFAQNSAGSNPYEALKAAKALGFVEPVRHAYTYRWRLTDKGRAWAAGDIPDPCSKPPPMQFDVEAIVRRMVFGVGDAVERLKVVPAGWHDVMLLTACGLNHTEIAQKLGVSARSVRDKRDGLYKRLDINSKAELAILLAKAGMV
jgi:DNA-binding CsgD family transcriptional regulator